MRLYETDPMSTERMHSWESGAPKCLIIGYGNSLRRDDGAGLAFATKLAALWDRAGFPSRLLLDTQLLPEMAEDIAAQGIEAVVFVDAADSYASQQIVIAEVEATTPTASTGHHLDPATLLLYAALLYGSKPRAWLVTIPGVDFGHGEGFDPMVEELLGNVMPVAVSIIERIKEVDHA